MLSHNFARVHFEAQTWHVYCPYLSLVMSNSSFTSFHNLLRGLFPIDRSVLNRHVAQERPTGPLSDRVTMHTTFPFLGLHQRSQSEHNHVTQQVQKGSNTFRLQVFFFYFHLSPKTCVQYTVATVNKDVDKSMCRVDYAICLIMTRTINPA